MRGWIVIWHSTLWRMYSVLRFRRDLAQHSLSFARRGSSGKVARESRSVFFLSLFYHRIIPQRIIIPYTMITTSAQWFVNKVTSRSRDKYFARDFFIWNINRNDKASNSMTRGIISLIFRLEYICIYIYIPHCVFSTFVDWNIIRSHNYRIENRVINELNNPIVRCGISHWLISY